MFEDVAESRPTDRASMRSPPWLPGAAAVRRGPSLAAAAITACLASAPTCAEDGEDLIRLSDAGAQLRIGMLQHDLDGYGGSENGVDLTVELRGAPLHGDIWRRVFSPRPQIGANLNDSGSTSTLYAGLSWIVDFGEFVYLSADFGGAVHNGKLETMDPDRAELGSRLLFHEALEIGIVAGERWRIGMRIDHSSNANLASRNDGLTNIGVLVSRAF